jgi:hypothetical protein
VHRAQVAQVRGREFVSAADQDIVDMVGEAARECTSAPFRPCRRVHDGGLEARLTRANEMFVATGEYRLEPDGAVPDLLDDLARSLG